MADEIAICVRNLGRQYRPGRPQEQYQTLHDAMVNSLKAPFGITRKMEMRCSRGGV
jgi:hypothetical protein